MVLTPKRECRDEMPVSSTILAPGIQGARGRFSSAIHLGSLR